MAEIKKDIEYITMLVDQVKKINENQISSFNKMRISICDLQKTWRDNVASHLSESFYQCEKSEKKRNEKMIQIIELLKNGIVSDSIITEEENKKLSEKFL